MEYLILSQTVDADVPAQHLAATSRVIKAADGVAVLQAVELLSGMRERDEEHRTSCARALAEARSEGRVSGRLRGRSELAAQIAAAAVARHAALSALAPVLTEIALEAAAAVVHGIDRQQCFGTALGAVQEMVQRARWARLRVHPGAADAAGAALRTAGPAWQIATVVPDDTLAADGCVLETDFGIADASLSVQLEALRHAIAAAVGSALASASGSQAAGEP